MKIFFRFYSGNIFYESAPNFCFEFFVEIFFTCGTHDENITYFFARFNPSVRNQTNYPYLFTRVDVAGNLGYYLNMADIPQIVCRYCKAEVPADAYFCPNCGKMLKEKTTISRQIVIYFISIFLPPFGLWYVWKYLKQTDAKSKKIAIAALVLTIVSTAATIWLTIALMNSISQQVNSINSGTDYNLQGL